LYVVDFGIIHIAPERGAIRQQVGTGSLWRIRRVNGPQGLLPPEPVKVPLYLLQGAAVAAVIIGVVDATTWFLRRRKPGRNGQHS
jgi:hypothetical protein